MSAADDSYLPPEQKARQRIDAMLIDAGWAVQDYKALNLYAATSVAVRELVTNAGLTTGRASTGLHNAHSDEVSEATP